MLPGVAIGGRRRFSKNVIMHSISGKYARVTVIPGFIDKDQPFRAVFHPRLAIIQPHAPCPHNISAIGFARQKLFFDGKSLGQKQPGQRIWMSRHAVFRQKPGGELSHRDVAFSLDTADQNINMGRQRTTARRTSLPGRCDRPRPHLALRWPNRRCGPST